jgi:hypothetical protein
MSVAGDEQLRRRKCKSQHDQERPWKPVPMMSHQRFLRANMIREAAARGERFVAGAGKDAGRRCFGGGICAEKRGI